MNVLPRIQLSGCSAQALYAPRDGPGQRSALCSPTGVASIPGIQVTGRTSMSSWRTEGGRTGGTPSPPSQDTAWRSHDSLLFTSQ